jgi:hypothetical protein
MKDSRAADSLREKKAAVDRELERLLVLDEGGGHG